MSKKPAKIEALFFKNCFMIHNILQHIDFKYHSNVAVNKLKNHDTLSGKNKAVFHHALMLCCLSGAGLLVCGLSGTGARHPALACLQSLFSCRAFSIKITFIPSKRFVKTTLRQLSVSSHDTGLVRKTGPKWRLKKKLQQYLSCIRNLKTAIANDKRSAMIFLKLFYKHYIFEISSAPLLHRQAAETSSLYRGPILNIRDSAGSECFAAL
jgi:hypothetical protein